MKIIAFIEEDALIAKILKHVGLWEQPLAHGPPPVKPFDPLESVFEDPAEEHSSLLPDDEYEHSQLLPPEFEWAC
jgi:hypothetical protein